MRNVLLAIAVILIFITPATLGQVQLTGLLQDGVSANGDTAQSPIWNTLGNQVNYAKLYVTQPNGGAAAPFINHGSAGDVGISYSLTPDSYQFFFYNDPFATNTTGYYGLTLFFDGDNTDAGIAAFSPTGVQTAAAVPAGLSTLSLNGDNANPVPSPGSLLYSANGLNVTLTDYTFWLPGATGNPGVDRVGNLNDVPDGDTDGFGEFDLSVTAVPEPVGLLSIAIVGAMTMRPNRMRHRRP